MENLTEVIIKWFNGNIRYKYYLNNGGHLHGLITQFYPSGKIFRETNWNNGVKIGESVTYFENGMVDNEIILK